MANWRSFSGPRAPGRTGLDGDVLSRAGGWLWPSWAERQLDPDSPAFVPLGPLAFLPNVTARNWTVVGNLASSHPAVVDPRGLVTPTAGGWSVDWWIGAEDRWHFPSREPAVRQSLPGSVPVVETAMRIPGGDAVQRVYALPAAGSLGEVVVVEVENLSPVPVAVAFAVRPYHPDGLARVGTVDLTGTAVRIDGRTGVLLPRPPSGVAGSTLAAGDSIHPVMAGRAVPGPLHVEDPDGLAQAAFVYPLPHRTVLRVALPLSPERRKAPAAVDTSTLASAADVTRSWQAQLRRGLRLDLPDPRLQAAVDANRAFLLLFPAPDAQSTVTMDRYGFHTEAAEALASSRTHRTQPPSAPFGRERGGLGGQSPPRRATTPWHADAAKFIWATANHSRLTGDTALLERLLPAVRAAAHHISSPSIGEDPYESSFWRLRALHDAAWLLRLGDQGQAAGAAETAAGQLRDAITASLDGAAGRLTRLAMPAGPGRGLDPGMLRSLVACAPLGLLPLADPWVAGTLDVVRDRFCIDDAFYDPEISGLSPAATLLIAACELQAGEQAAWRRLRWVLDAASVTWTWPEAVHPRLGGGCGGDGHHGGVAAAFLDLVRQVLVRETPDGGLALASLFPPEWAGQPLEVHDAPTASGRVSYALRWHGDRPALLWQCERAGVPLTVPGLDRTFSTTEPAGEALLAPYRARIPIPLQEA